METLMRKWQRAERDLYCGRCGAKVPRGEPIQRIDLQGMTRGLYRGQCCAGEAPPDLHALPVRDFTNREPFADLRKIDITRTRGGLRSMASQYLPHPND